MIPERPFLLFRDKLGTLGSTNGETPGAAVSSSRNLPFVLVSFSILPRFFILLQPLLAACNIEILIQRVALPSLSPGKICFSSPSFLLFFLELSAPLFSLRNQSASLLSKFLSYTPLFTFHLGAKEGRFLSIQRRNEFSIFPLSIFPPVCIPFLPPLRFLFGPDLQNFNPFLFLSIPVLL